MSSSERGHRLYTFDSPPADDVADWPRILGGKGAGLARMHRLGLPVPPGFTIPTMVCNHVLANGWADEFDEMVASGLSALEARLGRRLGSATDPLLVSIRSGAPVSMPGMMDTVLNAGMTPEVAAALGRGSGNERFGYDTHRRFIESYASVVSQAPADVVQGCADIASGGRALAEVPLAEKPDVLATWCRLLSERGHTIPENPVTQVTEAVKAVFGSWLSERAAVYRERENISAELGTAANVQAMVFGNQSDDSGTGVAFTRDPSTGEAGMMGDFLVRAQGEDVVAGTHATEPISTMNERWPEIGAQLATMATTLEHELADMVDIEFTVENAKLWLLQARVGKRSPRAALRVAVEMAEDDGFPLDRQAAVARVAHLLDTPPSAPSTSPDPDAVILAEGLAASPGRAVGEVCIDPDAAVVAEADGVDVVLVRPETSPADVHGMAAARGLVTTLGGLVSHAAVVARSWGVPAVVGAAAISIEADGIMAGQHRVAVGTLVTVDGDGGRLLLGAHPGQGAELAEVKTLRRWQSDEAAPADRSAGGSGELGAELDDASCLRALALKGMATADGVAEFAAVQIEAADTTLLRLVEQGGLQTGPGDRFMLTPQGTSAVDAAYAAEAATAREAIEVHLDRFHELNARFKQVVTDWQMREVDGEQVMNDHDDTDYDASVLDALDVEIHQGIVPIIASIAQTVNRLAVYEQRLGDALRAVRSGDLQMMASPLRNSYHTVWFELHEELIRLSGRNRADEAAAGRA